MPVVRTKNPKAKTKPTVEESSVNLAITATGERVGPLVYHPFVSAYKTCAKSHFSQ